MVSIIIPVYNTEKYLDKCIQSILCQTYTDLEIIFINDGSTDRSLQILEKYQESDDRIQIVSVENGGQGRARNIGIKRATGEFIMFVDSDDWISEDCVEILCHTVEKEQCDIAIGSVSKSQFDEAEIARVLNPRIPAVINKENKRAYLFHILLYSFAQLIRRKIFTEYGIFFPSHYFEDVATMPLVYAMADKICYQRDVVYHYRNRTGSTVNNINFIYDRMQCVSTLESGMRRLGLYEEYKAEFARFIRRRSRANRFQVRNLLERHYQEFERRQFIFDYQALGSFEDAANLKAYVYGSYNLMIAVKIFLKLKKEESVPNYFGFQNIMSSMSSKSDVLDANADRIPEGNSFRKAALVQDFRKTMLYQEPEQPGGIDYFFLDFLEERYDTGCVGDACFTISDAFRDVEPSLDMKYGTLQCFGAEWNRKWHDKCDEFIQFIRRTVGDGKIILVKMKLSDKQKRNGEECPFDDALSIRRINEHLNSCYDYFTRHCPEALAVEVEQLESYYTDREFRHGCFPWHLNDNAYREIARELKKAVDFQKYKELISRESAVAADGI